jgi:DNA-binding Lrp family transcriptional regulator
MTCATDGTLPWNILRFVPETKISPTDVELLRLVQKNARVTNKELARAVGIAESTCLERVRSLQQRGIIRGWHAEVDLAAIGRPIRVLISVRLQPKTTEAVNAFHATVLAADETLSVATVSGNDDFIVEVAVADVEHLRAFLFDHITNQPYVTDTHTALVYEYHRKPVVEPVIEDSE